MIRRLKLMYSVFTIFVVLLALVSGLGLGYAIWHNKSSVIYKTIDGKIFKGDPSKIKLPGKDGSAGGEDKPLIPPASQPIKKLDKPLAATKTTELDFSTSDPIEYDAFEDYGKKELNYLAKLSRNWKTIRANRISSFYYPGKPETEKHLKRDSNGKITYDVNKDVKELPLNVKRVIKVFDENKWEYITPVRNKTYTYVGFLTAVEKYPRFCAEKNDIDPVLKTKTLEDVCKAELSNVFAHFAQEVGGHDSANTGKTVSFPGINFYNPEATWPKEQWRQGLVHVEELGWTKERRVKADGTLAVGYRQCGKSVVGDLAFPCFPGRSYHGRGAKQISYNFNYAPFSRVMYGPDYAEVLTQSPWKIAEEGWLALASAMYFYMTPRKPKPSIHDTVVGRWIPNAAEKKMHFKQGFGVAINIINGGIECGGAEKVAQAANRESYFKGLTKYFGIWKNYMDNPDYKHDCTLMPLFNDKSSTFYEPSWGVDYNDPNDCQLYSYEEGPFSSLMPGDYYRCLKALKTSKEPKFKYADYRAGKGAKIPDKIADLKEADKPYPDHDIFKYKAPDLPKKKPGGGGGTGGSSTDQTPVIVDNTVITDAMLALSEEQRVAQYTQPKRFCEVYNKLTWNKKTGDKAACFAGNTEAPFWKESLYEKTKFAVGEFIAYYKKNWYRNKVKLTGGQAIGKWGYSPGNVTAFEKITRS